MIRLILFILMILATPILFLCGVRNIFFWLIYVFIGWVLEATLFGTFEGKDGDIHTDTPWNQDKKR